MRRLPDSELEIMMALWELDKKATRAEIEEKLTRENKLSPTTVLSLLSRLEQKKFVRVEKDGKHNLYEPVISRDEYLRSESRSILGKMYNNSVTSFMTALYSDKKPSKKQLDELQDFIDQLKNGVD